MKAGKVEIEIDLNTKSFEAQIEATEKQLQNMIKKYELMKKIREKQPKAFTDKEMANYAAKIQEVSNKLLDLRKKQNDLQKTTTKGWENSLKGIKKVGLKMLSLASVYGIVSKASSAYLSQDTELAEKLQSVWVNLGAMLAPALEVIADVLSKAVGYLNVFIKALTGVDLIARANAKALKQQAKAQKELNRQTYDFDVIRTQQEGSSGGTSTSVSGGGTSFEMPELDPKFAETIQKLGELAGKVVGKLIQDFKDLKHEIEEYNKALKTENDIIMSNTTGIQNWTNAYWEAEQQGINTEKANQLFNDSLAKTTDYISKNIDEIIKQKNSMFTTAGQVLDLRKKEEEYAKQLRAVNDSYKKLYDQGKLNDEQKRKYKESLEKEIKVSQDLGKEVGNLKDEYAKIDGKVYTQTIKVNADTSEAEKKFSLLDTWKKGWNKIFGGGNTKKYATGGIVTQPTRAIIGEAGYNEYIIPETEDYIGRLASLINQHNGGGTTNIYLDGRLIQRQINDKQNEYNFIANR